MQLAMAEEEWQDVSQFDDAEYNGMGSPHPERVIVP